MAKRKNTPDAIENKNIALANKLAEQQLKEGTASSQVLTHFLKLGSSRDRLEKELIERKTEMMSAKTESLASAKEVKELLDNALDAMRAYKGGDA